MIRRLLARRPAGGLRVVYHRTGEFDAASEVTVEPDGAFRAESLSFVTNGFRTGRLTPHRHREMARLVAALGPPGRFGFYDRTTGIAELTVGGRLWMWPLYPPTPEIAALVRFLAAL